MQKVFFPLSVVDGYPPVSVESVWVKRLPSGTYRIKNIPFYTKEVSFDDEIDANCGEDGELVFDRVVKHSGNSTIRVISLKKDSESNVNIKKEITSLGCEWEEFSDNFYSVNIPSGKNLDVVIGFLESKFNEGWLDYEYGFLGQ
ncbi:hypothetical protein D3C86_1323810 [compost metagenome]|uniref:DUF4265 domain-containing protein n=1 Tax=Achromobacter sp. Root83 TaxID=1736602 RepID=UPI0009EBADE0|nr:DUF4265 domain-containing protein [Achromobacter sp. Root83]